MITGLLLYLTVGGSCSGPNDPDITPDPALKLYFQESYEDCRKNFLKSAAQTGKTHKNVRIGRFLIPSNKAQDLSMDYMYIPALKSDRLMVLSSGIHGIEGFAGSAMQIMFLKEILPLLGRERPSFLLLHAVNPFGFKHNRKVTENNVDLNRNSDLSPELFNNKNEGYKEFNALLNPTEKVDLDRMGNRFFFLRAVYNIAVNGMVKLREAALRGQYEYRPGIYFGGQDFEPQIKQLQPFLRKILKDYSFISAVDFHTGYGERAKLHFFPNPPKNNNIRDAMKALYAGYEVDYGDSDNFYVVTGDFADFVGKIYPEKRFVPMTFEYGTMDSQTTSGAIKSIHNTILENQGTNYGYNTKMDRKQVQNAFREMYYPSSKVWRTLILKQTRAVMPVVIKRFMKYKYQ